ncbi:hypothetical protein NC651_016220 [Populus alba x Populus x berolinensis]|nr:hypothetical protein NC651_016220 [Populus alba x Populus x berolinensis]
MTERKTYSAISENHTSERVYNSVDVLIFEHHAVVEVLGPHPKGKSASWSLDALETPRNLSGLNSSTSSP